MSPDDSHKHMTLTILKQMRRQVDNIPNDLCPCRIGKVGDSWDGRYYGILTGHARRRDIHDAATRIYQAGNGKEPCLQAYALSLWTQTSGTHLEPEDPRFSHQNRLYSIECRPMPLY